MLFKCGPWGLIYSLLKDQRLNKISNTNLLCSSHRTLEGEMKFPDLSFLISVQFSSVQFTSVAQSCPTLCDPMNHSTPVLPVHHQLLELTETHVHRVGDAIHPPHPLSSPSPPAPTSLPASRSFPMSQLFAWGGQSNGVSASASVLPMNTQDWSLGWTGCISLQSKGLSRVFSNTTV